ncbi:MAG: hypothetical protein R2713_01130 [Ilumatobacteraceae bacterium]
MWGPLETDIVQQVADTLANLLARHRDAEALQTSETKLGAMLAAVRDVLLVIDRDTAGFDTRTRASRRAPGASPTRPSSSTSHARAPRRPRPRALGVRAAGERGRGAAAGAAGAADGSVVWFDGRLSTVDDPVVGGGYMISLRDGAGAGAIEEQAQRAAEFERVLLELSQGRSEVRPDAVGTACTATSRPSAGCSTSTRPPLLEGEHLRNCAGWARTASTDGYQLPADSVALPALVARYRRTHPAGGGRHRTVRGCLVGRVAVVPVADRAGLNVPLVSGVGGNLGVSMADSPRTWRPDEIALVQRGGHGGRASSTANRPRSRCAGARTGSPRCSTARTTSSSWWTPTAGSGTRTVRSAPRSATTRRRSSAITSGTTCTSTTATSPHAARRAQGPTPTPITIVRLRAADGSIGAWR